MEDYIKCQLIGEGSPRHFNTFNLFCVAAFYTTYQHMLCIVDYTHFGSATTYFEETVHVQPQMHNIGVYDFKL